MKSLANAEQGQHLVLATDGGNSLLNERLRIGGLRKGSAGQQE